jgi:hypothetical protein
MAELLVHLLTQAVETVAFQLSIQLHLKVAVVVVGITTTLVTTAPLVVAVVFERIPLV